VITTKASVDTRTPAFAAREAAWSLMRDFMAGASALKTKARIPALSPDWDDRMWKPYIDRAYLFNATEISVDGFAGMVTIKPPAVEVPETLNDVAADITGSGHDVAALAAMCADELMTVGTVGLLADYPVAVPGQTIEQARANGIRPMVAVYMAESVLEVRTRKVGGKTVIDRVRLAETKMEADGEWGQKASPRVRALELNEAGFYQQRLFMKNANGEWVQDGEIITPVASGAPLQEIPFQLVTANGAAHVPPRPPLHTLAEANLAHLQDSALHQHGLAFCAQPVRFFAGVAAPAEEPPMIGSSIAVFSNDVNAKASIVEASPSIVGAIVAAMEAKRRDMAILGARFLAGDGNAQIAENTARINRSGDNASLSKITDAIESGLLFVLRWCARFVGADPDQVTVQMSRDYMPVRMDATDLQALVMAWQAGAITQADLYANLVQGEIVAPRQGGAEDFREELEQEAPGLVVE
jgi:hypothetical protein